MKKLVCNCNDGVEQLVDLSQRESQLKNKQPIHLSRIEKAKEELKGIDLKSIKIEDLVKRIQVIEKYLDIGGE